jgi:beta-lactamase superfamily II metal-dependent hydrolase
MKFKYIRPFFLTLVAFVSPFIFTSCNNGSQSLKITMIDVGQGSSTFITFPDKTTMLIDSGLDANKFKT